MSNHTQDATGKSGHGAETAEAGSMRGEIGAPASTALDLRDPRVLAALRRCDDIWRDALAAVGLRMERTDTTWVAYDGAGTILVADDATLDADDTLAQILFHELCHFVTEGPETRHLPDWGLDNTDDRHVVREEAALVLQAHWSALHGLREALVPTTDFRTFWETLPASPLSMPHPAATIARAVWSSPALTDVRCVIDAALDETRRRVERDLS